ncbi:cytochrome C biogenesis protein CcmE [Collibacillus ludicampi]|uniref:Cytochrome C biogenesis protein CcmE n=1 Tax=Collibacillus ludicampi TaxID=2771369 RepID=A0AAV4LAN7_9BACL|nr:cytochrome c maturation protein CcmE [Collibacillus ludicampi]GIM44882.1 cytochrome C biogenesis protein CcmE [Collibacillus ludicampi]
MRARTKLIVAFVLVIGVIVSLVVTGITQAATYYMTVGELKAKGEQAAKTRVKLSGNLVGDSVKWDPDHTLLQFSITDEKDPKKKIPVVYKGTKPDDFSNGWPVIVEGKLQTDGTFMADSLLVKCPSKYEAEKKNGG